MKKISLFVVVIILFLGTADIMGAEKKADFPQGRQINYLTGFAPGGKSDIQARGILSYVGKYLGTRFTMQYFPGAGGRIGWSKLFKAKPDGYTIGVFTLPTTILGEYTAAVEYKTREFTPIFACYVSRSVLLVAADTYKSLDELIEAGKTKQLTNAVTGIGNAVYLASLVTVDGLGLKGVKHIPFDSTAALAALAGKHVDFSVAVATNALPLVQAGKLKPLLVIADERDKTFPDVPVPRELGYKFTVTDVIDGFAGPPNLPMEKVKILERAFTKAAADPEFLSWADKTKMTIVPMDHAKFRLASEGTIKEVEKYKDVLQPK